MAVSAQPCSSAAAGLFARLQSGGRGQRVLEVVAVLICPHVPPQEVLARVQGAAACLSAGYQPGCSSSVLPTLH